ncbi:MAG: GAF domain-containing protein [Anaerolineae bacterium]|nr:MAG: GAF domain-containing protein [Anaerolineae bacterium]
MKLLRDSRVQFTLAGVLFGLMFPVIATTIDVLVINRHPLTLSNILLAQLNEPLLWIIDTAPIFLGLFAFVGGYFQHRVVLLSEDLQLQVNTANTLGKELESQNRILEARVVERTSALERRAQFVEAAADVGRAATSIYTLDDLLPQVTQFTSERFGFYHVGIFLVDDSGEFAVLRAANSDGGKRMIARGHRLKIGEEGLVGYVVARGEARIALDVGEDTAHFAAAELPETRSEMALPLYSGGRLFGALDIQSREAAAFTNEDIIVLRVLADQVSMAVNNALLFEQLQTSVDAERRAYGDVSRRAWRELLRPGQDIGFRFADNRVTAARGAWSPLMLEAASRGQSLQGSEEGRPVIAVPVEVSGQPIGVLHLRKNAGDRPWADEEVDLIHRLAEQLSQAVNSARLYQETQRRAAQEQVTSEIASNLRQTLDIDAVLRTAVQELGETFSAREVVIRINPEQKV